MIVAAGAAGPPGPPNPLPQGGTLPSNRAFALARYTSEGWLDLNFGPSQNGLVTTDFFSGEDRATGVAVLEDGKILVGGWADLSNGLEFALARYTSAGILDTTFGPNQDGKVETLINGAAAVGAVGLAVQAVDHKIVLAGSGNDGNFYVARYDTDGILDSSFHLENDYSSPGISSVFMQSGAVAQSLAIQSDGRILVGGLGGLARFLPSGRLDRDFGGDGRAAAAGAAGIAIQMNGRIVAAAGGYLERFLPDGTPDPSFGLDGYQAYPAEFQLDLNAVTLQNDGKIVAAGVNRHALSPAFAVIRVFGNNYRFSPNVHALLIAGTRQADTISILDDGSSSVTVGDADGPIGTFTGIRRIEIDTGAGDNVVNYQIGSPTRLGGSEGGAPIVAFRPADFQIDLGEGNDHFLMNAYLPAADTARSGDIPWNGNVQGNGGDDLMTFDFHTTINFNLNLTADLGAGRDVFDFNAAAAWSNPPVGTRAITVMGGGGDDDVALRFGGVVEANLAIDVNLGAGQDAFHLDAQAGWQAPPEGGSSSVHVVGESGDDCVRLMFGATIAADLSISADLGAGRDVFDFNAAAGWNNPPAGMRGVTVMAGGGDDDVRLRFGGVVEANLAIDVDLGAGQGAFLLDARAGWQAPPEGGSSSISVASGNGDEDVRLMFGATTTADLNIAVDTGGGADAVTLDTQYVRVAGALNMAFHLGAGMDRMSWSNHDVDVSGQLMVSVHGDGGEDTLQADLQPKVEAGGQYSVLLSGDDGNDTIRANVLLDPSSLGAFDLSALGGAGRDDIDVTFGVYAPDGSTAPLDAAVRLYLDGGEGSDRVDGAMNFSTTRRGRADAQENGSGGNDDLTLNVFGIGDPDLLTALIDGGPGIDTAHHTANVVVRNVER